jgi:hypothetical protein
MRCTYHYSENEDGMLPVEVELLLDYTFNKEVRETRGSYSGDTPGEPAYISDVTILSVIQVRLDNHGLMLHDKRWLEKSFKKRLNEDQEFSDLLTRHCEEDYESRMTRCDV